MASTSKGILWVGTSNNVIPGNKLSFPMAYRDKSRLHYYASFFNSLEVNRSFYQVPQRKTFERWAMDVPEDFQFTVKLWRGITHAKGLAYDAKDIDTFLSAANGLQAKKGCLLIQFPASIRIEQFAAIRKLLTEIRDACTGDPWRMAIELRHSSLYVDSVFEMLDEMNASLVMHDMPASAPSAINSAANFLLLRFHGIKGDYRGGYTKTFLQKKAKEIKTWLAKGMDVYVYFNNTIGDAFENAKTLQQLVNGNL